MRYNLFLSLSACLILSGFISAYSQQDSLFHYLEIASSRNPKVLQRYYEYQAALQKVPQAGSLPDPELSIGVFMSPMELVAGNQAADIRLMQMFPWFGVLKYAKDEMSLMANAKFEVFRDAKLQVCYDVQRTWFELFKIQKQIEISEKNIGILKIIESLALAKYSSPSGSNSSGSSLKLQPQSLSDSENGTPGMGGMGGNQRSTNKIGVSQTSNAMKSGLMNQNAPSSGLSDIYMVQIEAGDLENNIGFLKNQLEILIAQFNNLLNRPVNYFVYLPDRLYPDSLVTSFAGLSDSMLVNNPMLGMADFESRSIDARKKMVTRMGYPMIGVGLNYSLINRSEMSASSMNGKDMIMPMLTVTIPVYRKKYTAMQKEADFMKNASDQNYQEISNNLKTEYLKASSLYNDAERRVKLYDYQSVLSSKSFDLMLKSFSVSLSDLTEVLRARQQTLDYEMRAAEAMADLNTAVAWLKRLGNSEIGEHN
jgi:outer membrane protein TolC